MIPDEILKRKGARSTALVPPEVKALLDAGEIETVNLCEWIVVDQERLAGRVLNDLGWADSAGELRAAMAAIDMPTSVKRSAAVGGLLSRRAGRGGWGRAFEFLKGHRSDIVRSWACLLLANREECGLADRLALARPLAADRNMGVRESAWMAVREPLAVELGRGVQLLLAWTSDPDPNIRRFASEATRPRGVWCRHIDALKRDPSLGLPVLEPLKSDPSRYVQNSVANWLNDASKSQPEWVRSITARWLRESPAKETEYIVRRALRTLEGKQGGAAKKKGRQTS